MFEDILRKKKHIGSNFDDFLKKIANSKEEPEECKDCPMKGIECDRCV